MATTKELTTRVEELEKKVAVLAETVRRIIETPPGFTPQDYDAFRRGFDTSDMATFLRRAFGEGVDDHDR